MHYWAFMLPAAIALILGPQIFSGGAPFRQTLIWFGILIILMWPALAIQVKRWHDVNKSGYWVLINFVPLIGSVWAFLELGFLSGSPSNNNYGNAPPTKHIKSNELAPLPVGEHDRKTKAWIGLGIGIILIVFSNLKLGGSDSIIGSLSRIEIISGHLVSTNESSELKFLLNCVLFLVAWNLRLKIGTFFHYLIRKV